jgi:putative spermidine/putrescine transport system substrate-binding protein
MPSILRAKPTSLVTTFTGGKLLEVYRSTVVQPFEAKYGVTVNIKSGTPNEWLTNTIINRSNPEIDLLWLVDPISFRAVSAGLCEEISVDEVPNSADIYPEWFEGYKKQGVGHEFGAVGIAYRTDMVKEPPKSWKDLWSPQFKDRLAMPDLPVSAGFETLLMAARVHGGSESNIDPGFSAIAALKPNIRKFYTASPEAQQMFARSEVAAGSFFNARANDLKASGAPLEWVSPIEGAVPNMVAYHVVKNARARDLAMKFLDFAISPEIQGAFCSGVGYAPTNRKTVLNPDVAARLPAYANLAKVDWWSVVPNMTKWLDRWSREIN